MKKLILVTLVVLLSGCQSAYYAAWEKVGVEKRDILIDRVEDAKESQEDAQLQFSSALDEFSQLINFNGGELQGIYEQLKDQFEASEDSAASVTARIDKVESVAEALFDEWQQELQKYTNATLKRDSQRKLKDIYGRSRDVNVVLYLRADFQHKFRFNLILPLVCYVEGSLKNGLVLTYIQAL